MNIETSVGSEGLVSIVAKDTDGMALAAAVEMPAPKPWRLFDWDQAVDPDLVQPVWNAEVARLWVEYAAGLVLVQRIARFLAEVARAQAVTAWTSEVRA